MRNRIVSLIALFCCAALLVFSDACLDAARSALAIWWNSVLPALLPFSVFLSLAESAGLPSVLRRLLPVSGSRWAALANALTSFLFGAISGFPNGARIAASAECSPLAAYCNLCSPIFLHSVICCGLLKSPNMFAPLYISHCLSALVLLLASTLTRQVRQAPADTADILRRDGIDLIGGIRESIGVLGAVGGCMVVFSVLLTILCEANVFRFTAVLFSGIGIKEDVLRAAVHGLLEFSGGCAAIASLSLPLRIKAVLISLTISFGGFCVLLQSRIFLPASAMRVYLLRKALHALLSGLLCYTLFPAFLKTDMPALNIPNGARYIDNSLTGLGLLFASAIPLAAVYLAGLCLKKRLAAHM